MLHRTRLVLLESKVREPSLQKCKKVNAVGIEIIEINTDNEAEKRDHSLSLSSRAFVSIPRQCRYEIDQSDMFIKEYSNTGIGNIISAMW